MTSRYENREFPLLCQLLLTAVLVFLFNSSNGIDHIRDNTNSPVLSHAQALSPVVPVISQQPQPGTSTEPELSIADHMQERLEQYLQRITRVMLIQAKTDRFQLVPARQQQFYYHYFSQGKIDIPAFC
jgi:hypothetical protein